MIENNVIINFASHKNIREVFKRFEFGVAWRDFDNLGDEE